MNTNNNGNGNNSNPYKNPSNINNAQINTPYLSQGSVGELNSSESARRPSIAERVASVASGVGVGIRKASTVFGSASSNNNSATSLSPLGSGLGNVVGGVVGSGPSGLGSGPSLEGGATDQNPVEATISMKPEDYELKQVIGMCRLMWVLMRVTVIECYLVAILKDCNRVLSSGDLKDSQQVDFIRNNHHHND